MMPACIRCHFRVVCLLAMLGLLALAPVGFGGAPQVQAQAQAEPQTVGAVSNLAARADGQPAGTVRVSWDAADNAQTHFVVYLKSADAAAGSYAGAQMAAFSGADGVIGGLEPGTAYSFIVIGMRWNWVNYGAVWGQWSDWAAATPSGTAGPPAAAATPAAEPQTVGRVTGLAVSTEGQPAGTVRVSYATAGSAQTHFVAYVDAAAGSYAGAQMAAFSGAGGVISGLEPGVAYNFTAIGMRWNWGNYGAVWGQWSDWAAATPGAGSAASDRAALIALYHATDGPKWIGNDNWLSDAPLDEWYGVTTDRNGRVIRLDLNVNGLRGTIPAELGNLANLQELDLRLNDLTGAIPAELGNLANLQRLDLRDNRLTGAIPAELGNLANLEVVPPLQRFDGCDTGGVGQPRQPGTVVPATTFDGCDTGGVGEPLRSLYLRNQLTGGIPAELGNLANLERLYLHGNQLTGCDTGGVGQPRQLAEVVPPRQPVDGVYPGDFARCSRA